MRHLPAALLRSAAVLLTALVAAPAQQQTSDHDLVVYGGTSAGITTALAAARHGRSVLLLEPTQRIGGLTTNGLGATDIGNKAAIGGLSRDFYRRLRAHYTDDAHWTRERREDFRGRGHREGEDAAWTFEPGVALRIFREMLAEQPGIELRLGVRLDLDAGRGVERDGTRIVAIHSTTGERFTGRMFVDATYEGDLMAKAGVPYRVGREANAEYGETLNGIQFANAVHHQFTHEVDPYVVPGDADSGLLRWIQAGDPGKQGDADHRVQAYCMRMCTTDVADNRHPWTRPDGYDPADFELAVRNVLAGDRRRSWNPVLMPNRKTDTNNNFAVSLDAIGLSWRWPEADWAERDRLFDLHRYYIQGLLYTYAHDERIPEDLRAHYQTWGRARDEFEDSDGWPQQLYVREGRRMVGDVVLTELHCRGLETAGDPVGLGAYGMDSHHVQRYVTPDGKVRNEGDVQVHGFSPYGISYRSIVPPRGSVTNLLVPVAVSSSHIAFGSLRMEPVFMVLGHSAGIAAHQALDANCTVQALPYEGLAQTLRAEEQVLEWAGPRRVLPLPQRVDPAQLDGVVVDDQDARLVGAWRQSTSVPPYVGAGYNAHEIRPGAPALAVFVLEAERDGPHQVQVAWQPHPNRAADVRVQLSGAGGSREHRVDQRQKPPLDALWQRLGTLTLRAGQRVTVTLRAGTDAAPGSFLIADATRLLPVAD